MAQSFYHDSIDASFGPVYFYHNSITASPGPAYFYHNWFYTEIPVLYDFYHDSIAASVFPPASLVVPAEASGLAYREYYLYSQKMWEMAPSGVSAYTLEHALQGNAPVVVTSSGHIETSPDDPWAMTDPVYGYKYTKVGYGGFTLLDEGAIDTSQNEFCLHPDSSGKLIFNKTLQENVFIEYEAGPSGFYILNEVDVNPIANEIETGFIHASVITEPKYLYLIISRTSMRADGHQRCSITASLFDDDYDRVPEKNVIFTLEDLDGIGLIGYLDPGDGTVIDYSGGLPSSVSQVTNNRGEASVSYITLGGKSGVQNVRAYYQNDATVFDTANVVQYYFTESEFTLDLSLLDSLDYLI